MNAKVIQLHADRFSAALRAQNAKPAGLSADGVQPWSKGESYPWLVMYVERDDAAPVWYVTLAGDRLAGFQTAAEAERMALEFKRDNVQTDVQALYAVMADQATQLTMDAKERALAAGAQRQNADYLDMYDDPNYLPPNLSEVLRQHSLERSKQ